MSFVVAVVVGLLLAYANGANDNFKGVATLFGSGTTRYRRALLWATLCTFAGSVTALFVAQKLLIAFSGKGIIPESVVGMGNFPLSLGLAAGLTVLLATRLGFPISTTHALTGALTGIGLVASQSGVQFAVLIKKIGLPLLLSPVLAVAFTVVLFPIFRYWRAKWKIQKEFCMCIGQKVTATAPVGLSRHQAMAFFSSQGSWPQFEAALGTPAQCVERYRGRVWGFNVRAVLDFFHFLSAGAVSFARGLNDAPKIAAILVLGYAFSIQNAIVGVALAMALGGLISARKVAHKMSKEVTAMNAGQGFTANIVTSFLVIFASHLGMPVSTTHVSCSSLFGIGAVTKQAKWRTIETILLSWLITLPVAGVLGALFIRLL